MPRFLFVLLLLDWMVASVWLWRVTVWLHHRKRVPDLAQGEWAPQDGMLSSLSVIVPARNEEAAILPTLRSLLATEGVALEVIAVDDRSVDRTGALMEELAHAEAQRPSAPVSLVSLVSLKVLHVTDLPAGWLGKTHAMALGAQHATGAWLLFTDGDILFRTDALPRAVRFATESGADHLVLFPTVLLHTAGERMMVAFLQVLSFLVTRPWRVPDPKAKRDYIGVGAFNMIRREVYEALGGWESFRLEVVEDVALGRRVKARGFAQRAAFGPGLVSVRWAQGAFGVVNNLNKNLFAFFRFRPELLLGAACAIALFTLMPLVLCFVIRAAWWPMGMLLAALFLAYRRAGQDHDFTAVQAALYPVASCLLIYAMLRSMILALWRGGIDWRGTFYTLAALRKKGTASPD